MAETKPTREKIAIWSFPIFLLSIIVFALLFFGGRVALGFVKSSVHNDSTTVNNEYFSITYPCNPNKFENKDDYLVLGTACYTLSPRGNHIIYDMVVNNKTLTLNQDRKTCQLTLSTGTNSDRMFIEYDKTYDSHATHICLYKAEGKGYTGATATMSGVDSFHEFKVQGDPQTKDIYSPLMEKWLSTVRFK